MSLLIFFQSWFGSCSLKLFCIVIVINCKMLLYWFYSFINLQMQPGAKKGGGQSSGAY